MRIATWTIRIAVFLLLVALAAKNADPVTLRFFFDFAVQTPLALALFAAFAVGAVLGVAAMIVTTLRQRREIARLKRAGEPQAAHPPLPDL
jgi:uncharacterized integral membrane protein